jgi:hypothetical protein
LRRYSQFGEARSLLADGVRVSVGPRKEALQIPGQLADHLLDLTRAHEIGEGRGYALYE